MFRHVEGTEEEKLVKKHQRGKEEPVERRRKGDGHFDGTQN